MDHAGLKSEDLSRDIRKLCRLLESQVEGILLWPIEEQVLAFGEPLSWVRQLQNKFELLDACFSVWKYISPTTSGQVTWSTVSTIPAMSNFTVLSVNESIPRYKLFTVRWQVETHGNAVICVLEAEVWGAFKVVAGTVFSVGTSSHKSIRSGHGLWVLGHLTECITILCLWQEVVYWSDSHRRLKTLKKDVESFVPLRG